MFLEKDQLHQNAQIKSSENKLIICTSENLHHQISREKLEPESGLELRPPDL